MRDLLRVNLSTGETRRHPLPDRYALLGGRHLTAQILNDEVDPKCEPLGENNKLIFAIGLLAGNGRLTSSGRMSTGAKSPLTKGIKESNAGGITGYRISSLGLRAIVIEGMSAARTMILTIGRDSARLVQRPELAHKNVYETAHTLQAEYGKDWGLILTGPAGEMGLASACICNADQDGVPGRANGRGGLGAVMGAKGLKAILLEPLGRSTNTPKNEAGYREALKQFSKLVIEHPATRGFRDYGTVRSIDSTSALGCLPCLNFSRGSMPGLEGILGGSIRETIMARGGEGSTTHACMPGCLVQCSNIFPDREGKAIVAPIEYESLAMLGPNLGITDLDAIARLNYLANAVGVDSMEVGAALGVAMEAGRLKFGDAAAAETALQEIASGSLWGRLLGNGVEITGRVLGVKRIPAVKGQSFAAYDPRAAKGMGVTYATSPMGADHTAGYTMHERVDHHKKDGQAAASLHAQRRAALFDSLGLCNFVNPGVAGRPDLLAALVAHFFGVPFDVSDLNRIPDEVLSLERKFNRGAGLNTAAERLPDFMYSERIEPAGTLFDVEPEEMDKVFSAISGSGDSLRDDPGEAAGR
jgi:aldehyde:ferredoxin oxidoreductase